MKIYDAFILGGHGLELDLLEIRLNELDDVVDRFVIVESPTTHLGQPKSINFNIEDTRFNKFKDKITHFITEPLLNFHPWHNENAHRNSIQEALADYINTPTFNDWVMISDLDEIPSKEAVLELKSNETSNVIGIPLYYRAFYLNVEAGNPVVGIRAVRYQHLITKTPQEIRNEDFTYHEKTESCGYHLTYQGGAAAIKKKLMCFAHGDDYDPRFGKQTKDITEQEILKDLENLRESGYHPISTNWKKLPVSTKTLPNYIVKNKKKYKEWIL
jgi:beta-1,4-mannosyl-glycoprotein beta-1,4-N-acetylglucosaminyltransferase